MFAINRSVNSKKSIYVILSMIFVFVFIFGCTQSFAAKKPGKVKDLQIDDQFINRCYKSIPKNKFVIPVDIIREVDLSWKKVKGADGYRVYISKKGPNKGFKKFETIKWNSAYKGRIELTIRYAGFKNTNVWVKVKAFKKPKRKLIFGKPSKVMRITLVQSPPVKSIKKNGSSFKIKWKEVHKADYYEVCVAKESEMFEWTDEYNKNHPKNKKPYCTSTAYMAVAQKFKTTNTSYIFNADDEYCKYCFHVTAVYGKYTSCDSEWIDDY